jgi:helix-turn-helix protein
MTVASTVMFMGRGEISRQAWSLAGTSPEGEGMAVLKKGARITGTERNKLANDLRKQYDKGRSIRELAESHGRSYGFVHRVLTESGATLRGRGGATRAKKKGK